MRNKAELTLSRKRPDWQAATETKTEMRLLVEPIRQVHHDDGQRQGSRRAPATATRFTPFYPAVKMAEASAISTAGAWQAPRAPWQRSTDDGHYFLNSGPDPGMVIWDGLSIKFTCAGAARSQKEIAMYIAMNRFKVIKGAESAFEHVWLSRDTHLDRVPGFLEFHLLRGPERDDHVLYSSHTVWASKDAFTAWTQSEHFRAAHRDAGANKPLYLGHPEFEGFEAIQTIKNPNARDHAA